MPAGLWLKGTRYWFSVSVLIVVLLVLIVCLQPIDQVNADVACNDMPVGLIGSAPSRYGNAVRIDVQDSYAYLIDWTGNLEIYDISDPCHPVSIGSAQWTRQEFHDVEVFGDYAYVANDRDGLAKYDVSDPTAPLRVGARNDGGTYSTSVDISDGYLLASNTYTAYPGLLVYEMAAFPAVPASTYSVGPSWTHHWEVDIDGDRAYLFSGARKADVAPRFQVLDISQLPNPPTLLGSLDLPISTYGEGFGVKAYGDQVYLSSMEVSGHDGGLLVINVANPSSPYVQGVVQIPNAANPFWKRPGLDILEDTVYIPGADGLYGYDVSNPASPTQTEYYPYPTSFGSVGSGDVVIEGDYAFVSLFPPDENTELGHGGMAIYKLKGEGFNEPPVANDLAVTTKVNTLVDISLSASDVDGDPLIYYVGQWPQHGTLQGTPPNLTYLPNTDYYGEDGFSYVANDGKVNSNEANVDITVETPPPPIIVNVRRQYGRYFLHGEGFNNHVEVTVRWPQGNKPQRIEIKAPDEGLLSLIPANDIHPGPDGISVSTAQISTVACPLGACPVTIVAVGSANSSQPRVEDFFFTVKTHAALSGNGLRNIVWTPKGAGWIAGQDYGHFSSQMLNGLPELAAAEPIVRNAFILADDTHPFRIPSWVPIIGGDYGPDPSTLRVTDSATLSTVDSSLQSTTTGHFDYRLGNMGGTIPFSLAGQSIYVRDGTSLRFDASRLDFKTGGTRPGPDFKLPGILRLSVSRPYTGHLWAVYRESDQKDDLFSAEIYAMGAGINTSIESSGSIQALVSRLQATIGGGVGISRSYDLRTQSDISKADASVYTRVTWRVLFWSRSLSKTWKCEITYSDPAAVSCKESRSADQLLDWHRMSRSIGKDAYLMLTANDPDSLRWVGNSSFTTSELKLLDNVDVDVEPEAAIDPITGDLMVVFTQDNLASDIAVAYDIAYMRRTDNGWSNPLPLTTNQQPDVKPDVAFANGRAVAVWSTLDVLSTDDMEEPSDAFPYMEITASVFDPEAEMWSTPHLITQNTIFDFEPVVAGNSSKAMVVWYADPNNNVAIGPEASEERDMSVQLHYAVWDGSDWSNPAVLSQDVNLVGKPTLVLHDDEGILSYAIDGDGMASTIDDREIALARWNGHKWLPSETLTNDDFEDRLPSVAYLNGQPWAAWVHVTSDEHGISSYEVMSVPLDSGSPAVVQPIDATGQIEELSFAASDGGQLVLLWREFGQMSSGINYSVYDPQHEQWSTRNVLIDDDAQNADYSPLIDDEGHVLSTYIKTRMSVEESLVEDSSGSPFLVRVPVAGQSAIYFLDHVIGSDLAVSADDIEFASLQPDAGEIVDVGVTVHNRGDLSQSNIAIRFVEVASGTVVGDMNIDELPAGKTAIVHSDWKIPASAQMPYALVVEVDPNNLIGERDESNNVAEAAVGLPDLAATLISVEETTDRNFVVRATIENLGRSSSVEQTTVGFFYNDQPIMDDAVFIDEIDISALSPGAAVTVEYTWEEPNIAVGDYQMFVIADSEGSVPDPERANNQTKTTFRRSPGTEPDIISVSAVPTTSWVSASPGTTAIHRLILTNESNVTERFDLVLLDTAWSTSVPAQVGPLGPGQSVEIEFVATVPTNASGASETNYLIRARTDVTKFVEVTLITEARRGVYLPVLCRQ